MRQSANFDNEDYLRSRPISRISVRSETNRVRIIAFLPGKPRELSKVLHTYMLDDRTEKEDAEAQAAAKLRFYITTQFCDELRLYKSEKAMHAKESLRGRPKVKDIIEMYIENHRLTKDETAYIRIRKGLKQLNNYVPEFMEMRAFSIKRGTGEGSLHYYLDLMATRMIEKPQTGKPRKTLKQEIELISSSKNYYVNEAFKDPADVAGLELTAKQRVALKNLSNRPDYIAKAEELDVKPIVKGRLGLVTFFNGLKALKDNHTNPSMFYVFIHNFLHTERIGESIAYKIADLDTQNLLLYRSGSVEVRGVNTKTKQQKVKQHQNLTFENMHKTYLGSDNLLAFYLMLRADARSVMSSFLFQREIDKNFPMTYTPMRRAMQKYFGAHCIHDIRKLSSTVKEGIYLHRSIDNMVSGQEALSHLDPKTKKLYLNAAAIGKNDSRPVGMLDMILKATGFEIPDRYIKEAKAMREKYNNLRGL